VTGPSATERAGGPEAFVRLVDAFYVRVERDAVLRLMYPEDLGPGKRHLALFLAQYFGAENLYSDERGHPRLRMRHAPFPIDPAAAGRWATHMLAALAEQDLPEDVAAEVAAYVHRATPTLVNRFAVPGPDGPPTLGPDGPSGEPDARR
jgi:hemoglobin